MNYEERRGRRFRVRDYMWRRFFLGGVWWGLGSRVSGIKGYMRIVLRNFHSLCVLERRPRGLF